MTEIKIMNTNYNVSKENESFGGGIFNQSEATLTVKELAQEHSKRTAARNTKTVFFITHVSIV